MTVATGTWIAIIGTCTVAAWFIVHTSTSAPSRTMCGRLRSSIAHGQAVHVTTHLPRLEILQGRLEILDIAAGIANLRFHPRVDRGIVGRLPHLVGGIDDGLFTVNLALDGVYCRIFVHGGGVQLGRGGGRMRVVAPKHALRVVFVAGY